MATIAEIVERTVHTVMAQERRKRDDAEGVIPGEFTVLGEEVLEPEPSGLGGVVKEPAQVGHVNGGGGNSEGRGGGAKKVGSKNVASTDVIYLPDDSSKLNPVRKEVVGGAGASTKDMRRFRPLFPNGEKGQTKESTEIGVTPEASELSPDPRSTEELFKIVVDTPKGTTPPPLKVVPGLTNPPATARQFPIQPVIVPKDERVMWGNKEKATRRKAKNISRMHYGEEELWSGSPSTDELQLKSELKNRVRQGFLEKEKKVVEGVVNLYLTRFKNRKQWRESFVGDKSYADAMDELRETIAEKFMKKGVKDFDVNTIMPQFENFIKSTIEDLNKKKAKAKVRLLVQEYVRGLKKEQRPSW
jgi:hypothetical protein